jgi:pyruvate kinase
MYDRRVMRQLSLSFGVFADYIPIGVSSSEPIQQAICRLIDEKHFQPEDLIIVLAGSFGPEQGASYIEISSAASFKTKCMIHNNGTGAV